MEVVLKNSSLVFATKARVGWESVFDKQEICTLTYQDKYQGAGGDFNDNVSFRIYTVLKDTQATKIRVTAYVAKLIGVIAFRGSNDNIIGTVVTMASEGYGDASGFYTFTKDWPTGAVKATISFRSFASDLEGTEVEEYYEE